MKKGFWFIWIIACLMLLWSFSCSKINAQDVRFVSANTGNDTNSGVDFANAWLTLGQAVTDGQAAGDTVVCVGIFIETLAPTADGSTNNYITWIDSLRYTDGINAAFPDTSWTAIIDANAGTRAIDIGSDNFFEFVGFELKNASSATFNINSAATNTIIRQCKIGESSDVSGTHIENSGDSTLIVSTLVLESTEFDTGILTGSTTEDMQLINCTIFGLFDIQALFLNAAVGGGAVIKNTIVYNPRAVSSGDETVTLQNPGNSILSYDFNLYFSSATITTKYEFNTANFNLIATWEDSVNNYDGDGAANSIGENDPLLQSVTTTCFITSSSPAFEAGTDLGFGTDMGYYQVAAAAGAVRRRPPIIL